MGSTYSMKLVIILPDGNEFLKKKREKTFVFSLGTEGRDRTGTSVTSLVFETNASTYSATSA